MTIRQKMRNQRKRYIKSTYKSIKKDVLLRLKNTEEEHQEIFCTNRNCIIAVYLVALYLELKGYKCEVKYLPNDSYRILLIINW